MLFDCKAQGCHDVSVAVVVLLDPLGVARNKDRVVHYKYQAAKVSVYEGDNEVLQDSSVGPREDMGSGGVSEEEAKIYKEGVPEPIDLELPLFFGDGDELK